MKRITICAVIMAMFACVLIGCSGGDEGKTVQEDVVAEQVENVSEVETTREKTIEAILALDTYGNEAIAEIMGDLSLSSEYPEIYITLAEQYMAVEAYEDALFVLEVGAKVTGIDMLLDIRQQIGVSVGLLEEEEKKEREVIAGQHIIEGRNGTYLLTYDPEKIEMSGGAVPLETIGEWRADIDFSIETECTSAQEYIDEYVEFLKVIDEQDEIERYDEIDVSSVTQVQMGNVIVEKFSIKIVGMMKGAEDTWDNSYAFINMGTGDCLVLTDYYYDKTAEETGVDFLEVLSWIILSLEVIE